MVKIVLFVISLTFTSFMSLNAQTVDTTQQTSTVRQSMAYKEAFSAFKLKDYQKAFELFGALSDKYSGDEYVNFYYGRSAFELKKYEIAYSAFDRVLISNENNHRARLELARTLFLMKGYKEARKEFNRVLLAPIPQSVRNKVNNFIAMIDNKEKGYVLNKVAIFGLGWDNNVENTANPYLYNNQLQSTEKKSDTSIKAILVGNLIVPIKQYSNLTSESTAIMFWQKQRKVNSSNLFVVSLSSGLGYAKGITKTVTSLTYDKIWIAGIQTMAYKGIALNTKIKLPKKSLLTVDLKRKVKSMSQSEDYDKDSNISEIGLGYKVPLPKGKLSLKASMIDESKKRGTNVDIDKLTRKYKLAYDITPYQDYKTTWSYKYDVTKYDEMKIINSNDLREDKLRTLTLKIAKPINKKQTVSLELNDIHNNSNHDAYAYDKKSVVLNYTILF